MLTPTRELAIQVAEAFQTYAGRHAEASTCCRSTAARAIDAQLHALQRGVHVIVGTPGRIIDHLERGTLSPRRCATVVLDEADEMLRMGFIDDVDSILGQMPAERQVALFSATMPPPIRRIAQTAPARAA